MENYYFKISDYLHIACMGKHSVRFLLRKNGKEIGEIIIVEGILWNAMDINGAGEDAFLRLVFKKDIEVDCLKLEQKKETREINLHWEEILLKGVAERDKNMWIKSKENNNGSEKNVNIKSIIEKGLDSLMRRDYKNAIRIFSELNERYPGNLTIQSKLNKLKELGYEELSSISK